MQDTDVLHIDCECTSMDHSVRLLVDRQTGDVWLHLRLTTHLPWYGRLWRAIRYVFQPRHGRYGHYDETLISHESLPAVQGMLAKAVQYRAKSAP